MTIELREADVNKSAFEPSCEEAVDVGRRPIAKPVHRANPQSSLLREKHVQGGLVPWKAANDSEAFRAIATPDIRQPENGALTLVRTCPVPTIKRVRAVAEWLKRSRAFVKGLRDRIAFDDARPQVNGLNAPAAVPLFDGADAKLIHVTWAAHYIVARITRRLVSHDAIGRQHERSAACGHASRNCYEASEPHHYAASLRNNPRLSMSSAIWTAFSAAPLRKLSLTTQSERPCSTVLSLRMRETNVANSPTQSMGVA